MQDAAVDAESAEVKGPDADRPAGIRLVAALAAVLVVGLLAGFLAYDRARDLDTAASLCVRRAGRLADDLAHALQAARAAQQRMEARLLELPAAADPNPLLTALGADLGPLLAGPPVPMRLVALDREGRPLPPAAASPQPAGERLPLPAAAGWQVELTRGVPGARRVPLLRPAAANAAGVAAFVAEIDHAALLQRLESSRSAPAGSVALLRLEPDGSARVLARAPHADATLGQSLSGPLAAVRGAPAAGTFVAADPIDGVDRVWGYRRLDEDAGALLVVYAMAVDDVLAGWWRALSPMVAAALLLLAAIAVAARRFERVLRSQSRQRQALQRSELHFRALTANLPDVVVRIDGNGRHLYANAAVQQATGLPPEAVVGRTLAELGLPPHHVQRWMQAVGRVLQRRVPERLEFTFDGPQGTRQWESVVVPEPAPPREPPTLLVISRDITERREAEAARAALHRRLADLLESMADGFVSIDREWRYVAVNRRAGELLGRDPASLVGRHIWTEFPEGVGQPFQRAYERAMNEGVTLVMEEHYEPWDRWFENRIYPSADGISIFFTDVTERRRALQALRTSEHKLREAQRLAALGSWELDHGSGVLTWSDEVFRILEIDPERVGASHEAFVELIHPDDREAVSQAYQRSVDTREAYAITHRLRLADGRIKHVHAQGRSFYGDGGRPLRSVGTLQDVTDRVSAELALRASEASHREMFEANPHPMWVYDLKTLAFLAVNDAALRQYGYTREEFLRMTIKDIRPAEDVPRLVANVCAVTQGIDEAGTWRHRTRDGRLLDVEITSHTLRFEGRDAELVLAHDVTRRTRAERTLRDSEQRLRLALQAANQGLYDLDLRTGEAVVSPEYARMLGFDPESFHESSAAWLARLHPDDAEPVRHAFEDYVAGRRPDYRVEFRQRQRDGGWKWVLSVGRILERDAEGRPLRMLGTHTDLDAVKSAEAAQRAAARRFETLFQAAPEAMSVADLDGGRFLQVNDAFCELFGYARESVVGRTADELGLWSTLDVQQQLAERARAGAVVQGQEAVAWRRGREAIDVLYSAERIELDGRECLLLMLRDISQRRRLEDALRASESRLAQLLSRAPAVIYTARPAGDFAATYYSPNLPALLGWRPEQFLADSGFWLQHLHPDDRPHVFEAMSALDHEDDLVLEYRFRHADGGWRWMRDHVTVQRDAQGHAVELVGSWIDITGRREAEEQAHRLAAEMEQRVQERTAQLAHSEARYRAIFEAVPVSIGEEDWSGVQRLLRDLRASGVTDGPGFFAARPDFVQECLRAVRVVRINRKGLELHDARDQSADLPSLQAVYPRPEDLQQFVGEIEAMWAGQRQYVAKRSLPSVAGRPLSLMMTISLPALDDADGTALVCLVDITEIDRLNAELDRSVAQLRQVNRELETFTYSVSHDLKAPLRGIDGYSRLLLADHHERLDEEGREFLTHIRQATQHMGTLIDDLLSYSRLERRELALGRQPLAALAEGVLAGLRTDIEAAGVELEVQIDPGLQALADAQGLTMALRNLVDNALKFSRGRQPPRVRLQATRSEGVVRLTVVDNGVGFDMKFHDRIFSIFQRLHRAEQYPGTGIGLAIVRKAMERMGGRVWATSEPGRGASFTLELPEAR